MQAAQNEENNQNGESIDKEEFYPNQTILKTDESEVRNLGLYSNTNPLNNFVLNSKKIILLPEKIEYFTMYFLLDKKILEEFSVITPSDNLDQNKNFSLGLNLNKKDYFDAYEEIKLIVQVEVNSATENGEYSKIWSFDYTK